MMQDGKSDGTLSVPTVLLLYAIPFSTLIIVTYILYNKATDKEAQLNLIKGGKRNNSGKESSGGSKKSKKS